MSYLIRTGTGRNNISYGGGKSTKAKYLRRTGTGRNNISWIDINSNGTYNVLERTSTGRNNIRWYNTTFSFVGHKEISYYLAGIKDLNDNESTHSNPRANMNLHDQNYWTWSSYGNCSIIRSNQNSKNFTGHLSQSPKLGSVKKTTKGDERLTIEFIWISSNTESYKPYRDEFVEKYVPLIKTIRVGWYFNGEYPNDKNLNITGYDIGYKGSGFYNWYVYLRTNTAFDTWNNSQVFLYFNP